MDCGHRGVEESLSAPSRRTTVVRNCRNRSPMKRVLIMLRQYLQLGGCIRIAAARKAFARGATANGKGSRGSGRAEGRTGYAKNHPTLMVRQRSRGGGQLLHLHFPEFQDHEHNDDPQGANPDGRLRHSFFRALRTAFYGHQRGAFVQIQSIHIGSSLDGSKFTKN